MSNTNRNKGHWAERYYVNKFKELGFKFCFTSRYASRMHDDAKVDLVNLPFNVQIKAGKQKDMIPGNVLNDMQKALKKFFPKKDPIHYKPKILIHYKQGSSGRKRVPEDELVYMSLKQFNKFKKMSKQLSYIKTRIKKKNVYAEYRTVICMTFVDFVEKIVKKYNEN